MTITRDGKEYELTPMELHKAYLEVRRGMYESKADDYLCDREELEGGEAFTYVELIHRIADECIEHEETYGYCDDCEVEAICDREVEDYLEELEYWKENA